MFRSNPQIDGHYTMLGSVYAYIRIQTKTCCVIQKEFSFINHHHKYMLFCSFDTWKLMFTGGIFQNPLNDGK